MPVPVRSQARDRRPPIDALAVSAVPVMITPPLCRLATGATMAAHVGWAPATAEAWYFSSYSPSVTGTTPEIAPTPLIFA